MNSKATFWSMPALAIRSKALEGYGSFDGHAPVVANQAEFGPYTSISPTGKQRG